MIWTLQVMEHGLRFPAREHDRDLRRALHPFDVVEEIEFTFQNLLVEKKQRGEGLVLSGGRNLFFDGQKAKEGCNLLLAHFVGVPFVMEENEAADPIDVGLLGPQAVMLHAQVPVDALEQSRSGGGRRWWSHHLFMPLRDW